MVANANAQKHGVSSMFQKQSYKVTYLAILRGMIFLTYFLTPPKNHENVEKSKNEEHFVISVLKVGQGKKNYFCDFCTFSCFVGGGGGG